MVARQKQKAKRDAEAGLTSPTPDQIRATEEAKASAPKPQPPQHPANQPQALGLWLGRTAAWVVKTTVKHLLRFE
jgi:hypothetical protein